MCGIAGIVQFQGHLTKECLLENLALMSHQIKHRGPDDHGTWVSDDSKVGFAHRRLSIVDLSEMGHQPMISKDGRFVLTYNGEIYNYLELRHELEVMGVSFRTDSDSEVLLECYRAYGKACLDKFDGMFAFVIYDKHTGSLFAARDPFGEKPFYYSWLNGDFVFASELSALSVLPTFRSVTDLETVSRFLCLQYISGHESFYQGAQKLLPGHFILINAQGALSLSRYFEFQPLPKYDNNEDVLLDELETILLNNIKRRFRADVPVGAFLSGGLDSSLVVALATKKLGLDIQTFTIGFANWPDSEHLVARETAAYLGTRHTEKILEPDCYHLFDDLVSMVDEPNGDTSLLPTYLLSQLARKSVKVVLSGDGADELFGGYGRYFSSLAEAKKAETYNLGQAYYSPKILTFTEVDLFSLLVKLPHATCSKLNDLRNELNDTKLNVIDRLRKTDIENYLPGAVLAKVDRMSMRNALEVRTPFLSLEMAHFVEKLPPQLLADEHGGKYLLKKLAARYLPTSLIERPKRGFGLPQSMWGENVLLEKVEQRLLYQSAPRSWWLKQEGVRSWIEHGKKHAASEIYKLWSIYHLDKFIELNHVSPVNLTNPIHIWMLKEKLSKKVINTLVLSIFPTNLEQKKPLFSSINVSIWQITSGKLRYNESADWLKNFESVFESVKQSFKGQIRQIAFVGVNSSEIYKNSAYLRAQKLQDLLVFEDSMWQEHKLKCKQGWRSELDKFYPAIFSIQEKTLTSLTASSIWHDLQFFMRSTFFPFNDKKQEDPFLKKDKRLLFDHKTPLRAYALLRESFYALKHLFKENTHHNMLAKQISQGFTRTDSDPNKIIFILPSLYSGGAERQACNLMIALKLLGKDVRLLSLSPLIGSSAHYLPLLETAGIKFIDMSDHYLGENFEVVKKLVPEASLRLLAYDNPLVQRQIWPVFYRLFTENPRNVVCFLDTPNLIGGVAAMLAGVPRVITSFRNINPTSFGFYESWYDHYYAALIKSPNILMTGNSVGGNRSYAQWLTIPEDRIQLLRNGVDFAHIAQVTQTQLAEAKQALKYRGDGPLIGGIFRLSEEKRPDLFINIFTELMLLIPNIKGFIAGEGPLKSQLDRLLKEKRLESHLHLIGPVKKVSPFIALSSLILQTSRTEGTANSLLEAQFLRVPVVATPGGGVEESFADGFSGWLMTEIDPVKIAKKIAEILQNPDVLKERGNNGHEFVLKHFSLETAVQQIQAYFID